MLQALLCFLHLLRYSVNVNFAGVGEGVQAGGLLGVLRPLSICRAKPSQCLVLPLHRIRERGTRSLNTVSHVLECIISASLLGRRFL